MLTSELNPPSKIPNPDQVGSPKMSLCGTDPAYAAENALSILREETIDLKKYK